VFWRWRLTRAGDPCDRLLYEAVMWDQRDAAALLMRRGADPNLAVENGYSPLGLLVIDNLGMEDDDRVEFLKLLLDNGSDPNTRVSFDMASGLAYSLVPNWLWLWLGRHLDWDGPKNTSSSLGPPRVADNRDTSLCQPANRPPKPPTVTTHTRASLTSPRRGATDRGCPQAKSWLLKLGVVTKEEQCDWGVPLLSAAAVTCWDGGVELLLEYGADVTATALDDRWTPMAFACLVRAGPPEPSRAQQSHLNTFRAPNTFRQSKTAASLSPAPAPRHRFRCDVTTHAR